MKTKEQIEESLKFIEKNISKYSKKELVKSYAYSLYDQAEDWEEIIKLANQVLPREKVEYDGYAVVSVVQIVENLVNEIKKLEKAFEESETSKYRTDL